MHLQRFSLPGYLFSYVAGVGDSSDVVCLYVCLDVGLLALLPTFFTYSCLFVGTCSIITDSHHGVYLFIQILQVSSHCVGVNYSYRPFWRAFLVAFYVWLEIKWYLRFSMIILFTLWFLFRNVFKFALFFLILLVSSETF